MKCCRSRWRKLRKSGVSAKAKENLPEFSLLVSIIILSSALILALGLILSFSKFTDEIANALLGVALIGFFIGFIINSHEKSPVKKSKLFLFIQGLELFYNIFLIFSTLCFIRLTVLLPLLLSPNNTDIIKNSLVSERPLPDWSFKQFLIFSTDFLYSFSGIIVILFLISRIPLNHLKTSNLNKLNESSYDWKISKYRNQEELIDSAISKWNYVLATWFGLFTIFSTVAILGLG